MGASLEVVVAGPRGSRVVIILAGLVVAIALALFTGGDPRRLVGLRLEFGWLALVGLGLQILVINLLPEALPHVVAEVLHIATYAIVGGAVYANRHLPWMWLVGLGGAMNACAIVANGGVMPASPEALRRAGIPLVSGQFTNSGYVGTRNLPWLGDIFAVPHGWPLANVFSVGDVLLVVGAGLLVRSLATKVPDGGDGCVVLVNAKA